MVYSDEIVSDFVFCCIINFVSNEKVSVAYIKHALQMLSIFIEQQ